MLEQIPFASVSATRVRIAGGALLILLSAATVYAFHEHNVVRQLSRQNTALASSLRETRDQAGALNAKLNDVIAQQAKQTMEKPAQPPVYLKPWTAASRRERIDSPHWKQIQKQLNDQGRQIASTREDLTSTRTELGASIAKTHDQLVMLEKKGERNYYEFEVEKNSQFQHQGPVGIRLRKTNPKQQYADLELLVNDLKLSKKHVNVYEPVVFNSPDTKLPVELVINKISKNHIHGYVSEPKYKSGEMQAMDNSSVNEPPASAADDQSASHSKPSPSR